MASPHAGMKLANSRCEFLTLGLSRLKLNRHYEETVWSLKKA